MAGNDNDAASSRHEVSRALAALRSLAAPAERIEWRVAEQRWLWFNREIAVVLERPEVASRAELIEALWAMSNWLRYMAFHCHKLMGQDKEDAMTCWLAFCEPLERLQEIEVLEGL